MKYTYRKLNAEMPSREDIIKQTPNTASRELLCSLIDQGIETFVDRYEAQQPMCSYGLQGLCCRMCQWGPCRLSEKRPRGICGRDRNQVVMANLIRALVAGLSAHARHAHEVYFTLKGVIQGKIDLPLLGGERILQLAELFGINQEQELQAIAEEVTDILLEDLGRLEAKQMKMLEAFAPQESKELWQELGVLPRSASYEIMETMHITTLGGSSDWQAMALQELRSALAYCYSSLFGSSMATEMLYGIPRPVQANVNYGILKKDYVNLLVHGHSPIMAEKILEQLEKPEIKQLVQEVGAQGIVVAGLCCTGGELLTRHGVPTVSNILGQELVVGTGAVDAMIVDMQCVIPGMKSVADCFGTEVITTSGSNRIPGATHLAFDPEKPEDYEENALKAVRLAVEAFGKRDRSKIKIPQKVNTAVAGWSFEAIAEAFGGLDKMVAYLKSGKLKGIATVVGCNNPKVPYEVNHVTIVKKLLQSGILVTTTGCSSHALLNAGLCSLEAAEECTAGLKEICLTHQIPPVMVVGGCVDNTRSLRLFIELAKAAGVAVKDMPFIFVGPEPGNEKTVGQGVSFLAHGVSNVIGFPAPIPVPLPENVQGAKFNDEMQPAHIDVTEFFAGSGLEEKVGAKVFTEPYPKLAAQTIKMHIHRKRMKLGWK